MTFSPRTKNIDLSIFSIGIRLISTSPPWLDKSASKFRSVIGNCSLITGNRSPITARLSPLAPYLKDKKAGPPLTSGNPAFCIKLAGADPWLSVSALRQVWRFPQDQPPSLSCLDIFVRNDARTLTRIDAFPASTFTVPHDAGQGSPPAPYSVQQQAFHQREINGNATQGQAIP